MYFQTIFSPTWSKGFLASYVTCASHYSSGSKSLFKGFAKYNWHHHHHHCHYIITEDSWTLKNQKWMVQGVECRVFLFFISSFNSTGLMSMVLLGFLLKLYIPRPGFLQIAGISLLGVVWMLLFKLCKDEHWFGCSTSVLLNFCFYKNNIKKHFGMERSRQKLSWLSPGRLHTSQLYR